MFENFELTNMSLKAAQNMPINANFYWKNKEGFYFGSNDTMLELVGLSTQQDLMGKKDTDFSIPEASCYIEEDRQVMQFGKTIQFYGQATLTNRRIKFFTIKSPIFDQNRNIIGVFGISQHLAVYTLAKGEVDPNLLLTKRERECIHYLVKGKTSKEIAKVMALSSRTVEQYVSNIKTKLNCFNKSSLIEKAITYGLVNYHLLCDGYEMEQKS